MFRKLKAFLLYKNSDGIDQKTAYTRIMEENRKFAIIWSVFQILYWSFCLFMSTRDPDYRLCRAIYAASMAVCFVALLLALPASRKGSWLIRLSAVAVDVAFLGAGIGVAYYLAPHTIIIFASVLVVPVFFICDPVSTFVLLTANIIAFLIVGRSGMAPDTYRWTLTNLIIFSSIGLFLGFFVNKDRFERYYFAESAVKLAELQTRYAFYDQMTGLQNRRAHSEITDGFGENMPAYCCVVMVDINGLKEINDKFGHVAGDELIIGAAECLRRGFEGIDPIYRIGGDAFCVLLTDADTDAGQCLKRIEECCAGWKGQYINGISVSYGFADSKEFSDFDSIQKAADHRMYQFKRQYYISSGKDRRTR